MKKVLFVIANSYLGGSRTSLLNMLKSLKGRDLDIDVCIMLHRGEMLERLAHEGHVLPQDKVLAAGRGSAHEMLKKCDIAGLALRLWLSVKAFIRRTGLYEETYRTAAMHFDGKYDCVIACQEGESTDFCKYIKSDRKIAWIRIDYSNIIKSITKDRLCAVCKQFDAIAFGSEYIRQDFSKNGIVSLSDSISVFNLFDFDEAIEKSTEYVFERDSHLPMILSVGRLSPIKRFDRIISVAKRLKEDGIKFNWYLVGDGELYSELKNSVSQNGLDDCFFMTGSKKNPFPCYLACDLMVVSSESESRPTVATEAHVLGKPVITTDYPSARESVINGVDGIICENSTDALYESVKRVLTDRQLYEVLAEGSRNFHLDNEGNTNKIYDLICGVIPAK